MDPEDARAIHPGDWLHIRHAGCTVLGMIYRIEGGVFTFVYWEGCVLQFGNAALDQIGQRDEKLTSLFRGQIAVNPKYVEKCVAAWVVQPAPEDEPERPRVVVKPRKATGRLVQKRLFPE